MHIPPFVKLYEVRIGLVAFCPEIYDLSQAFVILEKEIEDSLPQFQELILTLKCVVFLHTCSQTDVRQATTRSLRRRLLPRGSGCWRLSRSTIRLRSGYETSRLQTGAAAPRSASRSP
jgi:hypothetical protein